MGTFQVLPTSARRPLHLQVPDRDPPFVPAVSNQQIFPVGREAAAADLRLDGVGTQHLVVLGVTSSQGTAMSLSMMVPSVDTE